MTIVTVGIDLAKRPILVHIGFEYHSISADRPSTAPAAQRESALDW